MILLQLVNFHANNCPSLHDLDLAAALPLQHSSSRLCKWWRWRCSASTLLTCRLKLQCFYVYEAPHLTIESFNTILEACPNLRQVDWVMFTWLPSTSQQFSSSLATCLGGPWTARASSRLWGRWGTTTWRWDTLRVPLVPVHLCKGRLIRSNMRGCP